MTSVNIEKIVSELSSQFRRAIEDTLEDVCPEAEVDEREFLRVFKRRIGHRCGQWAQVQDGSVRK